jgi:hypothetical protein
MAILLSCCGYILVHSPAQSEENDAQPADMIPQDEVVIENQGSLESVPVTYSVRIYKEPDRIKLKGNMSSEEDYKTLIGMVKANFPSVNLTDRVKIIENAPNADVKIGGLSFALKLLGYLENGQAAVDNNGLSLEGSASTAVVLTDVRSMLENDKPTGFPLKNIRIAPPENSWYASVKTDGGIKISGSVPNKISQKAIVDYAKHKFAGLDVEDLTSVNEKLPGQWTRAAQKSIDLLRLLDQGSIELTEQAIHLRGDAPSETTLMSIGAIANDLPSGFILKSEVTAPASVQSGVAAVPRPVDALAR